MLTIEIPAVEFYDEQKEEFIEVKAQTLTLEHSLLSVAKWESKWKISFFDKKPKTPEQERDYIRCMTITQHPNDLVYSALTNKHLEQIRNYISDPMTATTFPKNNGRPNREVVTAEVIYYWMTSLNIPFSCEKWHLNRLMTLIKLCSVKSQPPKKMSRKDQMAQQRALNAARRKKYNTKG